MNTRRTVLLTINAAGALGIVLAASGDLSGSAAKPQAGSAMVDLDTTGSVVKPTYGTVTRTLFSAPQKAETVSAPAAAMPPFRLIGIVSQDGISFVVVAFDDDRTARLKINDEIQGWRLDDIRRTSARFSTTNSSVVSELTKWPTKDR